MVKLLMRSSFIRKLRKFKISFDGHKVLSTQTDTRGHLSLEETTHKVPDYVKVFVCGGGFLGTSIAYHLAELGWGSSTLITDRGYIGISLPWHSSGLMLSCFNSHIENDIANYSKRLIRRLHDSGEKVGYKRTGRLLLARSNNRLEYFTRVKSASIITESNCELISKQQIQEKCPIVSVDDLAGALWIPDDGICEPSSVCLALAKQSLRNGVSVAEKCNVYSVKKTGNHIVVTTNKGTVTCDYFINAAGLWARGIAQKSSPKVCVPLYPCGHHYLYTRKIDGLDPMMPVVDDPDGKIYFRHNKGGLLAGGYEQPSKPAPLSVSLEDSRVLQEDWDQFYPILTEILHRAPSLRDVRFYKLNNGLESYSPDGKWILGESNEFPKYFVVSGMNTRGTSAAGGMGKILAEWITTGLYPCDFHDLDLLRYIGIDDNEKYLHDRVREVPSMMQQVPYPFNEFRTGRHTRMSPIFQKLKAEGAYFGQVMGYERPSWFDVHNKDDDGPTRFAYTNTFGKPPWFDLVEEECAACRTGVGLTDYSTFTKMDLWSPGNEVLEFLQYLCSNDLDIPVGAITNTGMQNEQGGYEVDCSIARLAKNHFMLIAPSILQTRTKAWIHRHLPSNGSVDITDVTSMYTAICLLGPRSRDVLSDVTDQPIDRKDFPFFTFRNIDVGLASNIRAMHLTHTGELGWVLYIPNEYALHVYNRLVEVGNKYGLRHVGYYATRSLRIEKFFAFWGQDLGTLTTPLECGRAFRVKFDKGSFIGRDALLKQKEVGVKRLYVQLILDDHDIEIDTWPWGGEPIFRDDHCVGRVSTTSYSFAFNKHVCLGFIQVFNSAGKAQVISNSKRVLEGSYEIQIGSTRFPAKIGLHSRVLPSQPKDGTAYAPTRYEEH